MAGKTPLVSIITPSFNKGPFIDETIQSVRSQTYRNIEHIVIDGGSSDQTLSILEKYHNDLHWISEPDRGQSDAINKGWRIANGEIIAYLNADDTYQPDAIETAVRFFEENPDLGMLYGDGVITDEYGKNRQIIRSGPFSQKELVFCRNTIFQPSVFLKKEVFNIIGEVDINLHLAMDLDYWLRTSLLYKIGYLPQPLSVAKIYRDAKSSALMYRYVQEYEYILGKLYEMPVLTPEIRSYRRNAYTYIFSKGSLDYLNTGMVPDALRYFLKGFFTNPFRCMQYTGALLLRYLRKSREPISLS